LSYGTVWQKRRTGEPPRPLS